MGLIDRLFSRPRRQAARAWFAPGAGYEGSRFSRRLRGWMPERASINALQARGGEVLRARTRQLVRDNALAASAVETWVGSAVGDGITPSPNLTDKVLKTAIKEAWLLWTDEADADGLTDFYGMQALAARAVFVAGECFVRFRPRRLGDGFSVPIQLQLLEAEQLPLNHNVARTDTSNEIRHGIEFNAIGQRVAYHFLKARPGDGAFTYGLETGDRVRVPASEVLHIYRPLEGGQIRGQSQLTAAMVRLHLLDSYDDAEADISARNTENRSLDNNLAAFGRLSFCVEGASERLQCLQWFSTVQHHSAASPFRKTFASGGGRHARNLPRRRALRRAGDRRRVSA